MAVRIPCPICDGSVVPAVTVAHARQMEVRRCANCRCYFRPRQPVADKDRAEPVQTDAEGNPLPPRTSAEPRPHFSLQCPICPASARPPTRLALHQRDRVLRCAGCGGYFRAAPHVTHGDTAVGVSTNEHGVPLTLPPRSPPPVLISCPICPSAVSAPWPVPVHRHCGEHRCPVCGVRFLVRETAPGELAFGTLLIEEQERRRELHIHPLDPPLREGRGGFPRG